MAKCIHAVRKVAGFLVVFLAFGGTAYGAPSTPEIAPGSSIGALTLLAGGIFLLTARFRRSGKSR
jgi:hypothetical protein